MLEITVCLTVHCDVCGHAYTGRTGGLADTIHLDATEPGQNITDTLTAAGWRIGFDDALTCRTCAGRADCTVDGHLMPRWSNCLCQGAFPDHRTDLNGRCVLQHRLCTRCHDKSELRPRQRPEAA